MTFLAELMAVYYEHHPDANIDDVMDILTSNEDLTEILNTIDVDYIVEYLEEKGFTVEYPVDFDDDSDDESQDDVWITKKPEVRSPIVDDQGVWHTEINR